MVQIWPSDDTFLSAGTDFTFPNRYVRFDPSGGSTTYPSGLLIASVPAELVEVTPQTPRAACIANVGAAQNASASFYARTQQFSDGEVAASFERYDRAGNPISSTMSRMAVYGRVNKSAHGLVSSSGEYMDEYLDRPDCVEFAVVKGSFGGLATDCYFTVGYYTAGAYTSLGEINIASWSTATLALTPGLSYYEISRLRMVMNGTNIKCYVKPKGGYAMNTTTPVRAVNGEIEVFDVFVPLSSGYAGFGAPTWWQVSTDWNGVHALEWFQAKNSSGTILRDEFERPAKFGSKNNAYGSMVSGWFFSIAGAYSGDGVSRNWSDSTHPYLTKPYMGLMHGVSGEIRIGRSIPASFADPDLQLANYGFMYDAHDFGVIPQRRQLDLEFNDSGGASCGIMLRAAVTDTEPEPRLRNDPTTPDDVVWDPDPLVAPLVITPNRKDGYCCMITHDGSASPAWKLRILRFYRDGATLHEFPPEIASADLTLFGLSLGTTIELDFEVRNFNSLPDGSGGNLAMRAAVDGVDVDLVAGDIDGVSFQDGWLYDISAQPNLYTNTMSGMFAETYLAWGSAVADHVVLKRWQHLALSDPPVTTDPDQPSVALEAEDYGKTGTFDFPIDWSVREDRARPMRDMRTEAHFRYSSPIGSRGRRSWSLKSTGLTDAQRDEIIEFLKDHKGPEIPFDWYRADTGDTISVRYMTGSFSYRKDGLDNNSCGLSFEEVFSELEYNAQA